MRTKLWAPFFALAIALAMPGATLAGDPPVAVYHGTWATAGWTFDPVACPFPPEIPASGNWNVTILPGGRGAVVHLTMFALDMHIDSWGGRSFGEAWTVKSRTSHGFELYIDLTHTPYGSMNTFVLEDGTLTFQIAPWVVGPFSCAAATAIGVER